MLLLVVAFRMLVLPALFSYGKVCSLNCPTRLLNQKGKAAGNSKRDRDSGLEPHVQEQAAHR